MISMYPVCRTIIRRIGLGFSCLCLCTCTAYVGAAQDAPVDSLIVQLRQGETEERVAAAKALRAIIPINAEIIDTLAIALRQDEAPEVRQTIAAALGQIGVNPEIPEAVIDTLAIALRQDSSAVVRVAVALTLRNISSVTTTAGEALVRALQEDADPRVRTAAVEALGAINLEATLAINALTGALENDAAATVRRAAAEVLGWIGPAAASSITVLTTALREDKDLNVRKATAEALGKIGAPTAPAVDSLIVTIQGTRKDKQATVREAAAEALGKSSIAPERRASALIVALADLHWQVRKAAAKALGRTRTTTTPAVDSLVVMLQGIRRDKEPKVREAAAEALGEIAPADEAIARQMANALEEPYQDADENTRINILYATTQALVNIGPPALPVLISLLNSLDPWARGFAARALLALLKGQVNDLNTSLLSYFEQANRLIVEDSTLLIPKYTRPNIASNGTTAELDFTLDEWTSLFAEYQKLASEKSEPTIGENLRWLFDHPLIAALFFLASLWPLLALICVILLFVKPWWLIKINEWQIFNVPPSEDASVDNVTIPFLIRRLRYVFLVGFFYYSRNVLDAWVEHYLPRAQLKFNEIDVVKDRIVHLALPVKLGGRNEVTLTADLLQNIFAKNNARLLIFGSGGIGKTSLACKLGHRAMATEKKDRLCRTHLMLPVLIESDFENFLDQVSAKTRELIDATQQLNPDFLRKLLEERRLLIILDHFSEMKTTTQKAVPLDKSDFAANALIITSRFKESADVDILKDIPNIQPLPIEAKNISGFINDYLMEREERSLFTNTQFERMLEPLHRIMVGERKITVFLAKHYAERMIAAREHSAPNLPKTIPDLMLDYLESLDPETKKDPMQDIQVQRVAKQLAWICLKETYRPAPVQLEDVHAALRDQDEDHSIIDHFEKKLGLIQRNGRSGEIKFTIDPLAEYLAGLYVVEHHEQDSETNTGPTWDNFLAKVDKPEAVQGFLLAVLDCYINKNRLNKYDAHPEGSVPDKLIRALPKRLQERIKRDQQVWQHISTLEHPATPPGERIEAARALGELKQQAEAAVKPLVKMLKNERYQPPVRLAAASALKAISPGARESVKAFVTVLTEKKAGKKDQEFSGVRDQAKLALDRIDKSELHNLVEVLKDTKPEVIAGATEYLRRAATETPERIEPIVPQLVAQLVKVLEKTNLPIPVREGAARTLGIFGEKARPAIDDLITVMAVRKSRKEPGPKASFRATAADVLGMIVRPTAEVQTGSFRRLRLLREANRNDDDINQAIEALKTTLEEDQIAKVRQNAVRALRRIGPAAHAAEKSLRKILTDPDRNAGVRQEAVMALGEINPPSSVVVRLLVEALQDKDAGVREKARQVLSKIDSPPGFRVGLWPNRLLPLGSSASIVRSLVGGLKIQNPEIRKDIIAILGRFKASANLVVKPLIQVLVTEENEDLRHEAASALARIGSPAVKPLIRALKHPKIGVRIKAIEALGRIGPQAGEAIKPLAKLLGSEAEIRQQTARTLGKIGPEAEAVIGALLDRLDQEKEPEVFREVMAAIGAIGSSKETVIAKLVALLQDGDAEVRQLSAWVLGQIKPNPEKVIDALLQGLEDAEAAVRREAVVAVGAICPAEERVRVQLRAIHANEAEEEDVRLAAGQILRQNDPLEPATPV